MTGKGVMMVLLVCAVTFSEQYLLGKKRYERSTSDVPTCTDEFKNITDHTMCMPDHSDVDQTGVSAADIDTILQIHNANRSNTKTPATNLIGLVWNDQIAAVAQKHAQTCPTGRDKQRWVPSLGLSVGQNLAWDHNSWAEAVVGWSSEAANYTLGSDRTNGENRIGTYTQMVQSSTFLIGCGFATCRNTKYTKYYVCNYASAQTDPDWPYIPGTRCSACPSNCENGLCNCKGLVCLNGGTMDLDKCTCQCHQMYKGNNCSEWDCSLYGPKFCTEQETLDCNSAYHYAYCPDKCGRCPPKETFTSPRGCNYQGPRYSAEECKEFVSKGKDQWICGRWSCGRCSDSFIPKDYCPVMCGLCDKQ